MVEACQYPLMELGIAGESKALVYIIQGRNYIEANEANASYRIRGLKKIYTNIYIKSYDY